jgi:hypothetical protein
VFRIDVCLSFKIPALTTALLIRYEWYSRVINPVGTAWGKNVYEGRDPVKPGDVLQLGDVALDV